MWWIAACLGALAWLLVVRIRLKEKQRARERAERQAQSDKRARRAFTEDAFLPAARHYLNEEPEVQALLLLIAQVEWPHKPPEIHLEVVPVTVPDLDWPEAAEHALWVTKDAAGGMYFAPPQAHWDRLVGLEPWRSKLACFASVASPVGVENATIADYVLYAAVRRGVETPEWEVVGEPD